MLLCWNSWRYADIDEDVVVNVAVLETHGGALILMRMMSPSVLLCFESHGGALILMRMSSSMLLCWNSWRYVDNDEDVVVNVAVLETHGGALITMRMSPSVLLCFESHGGALILMRMSSSMLLCWKLMAVL
jgi:hypothetical protein